MKIQDRIRIDHCISVIISVVLNGGLILSMIHFITAGPEGPGDFETTLMLDPVAEVIIDEPEDQPPPIPPEPLDKLPEMALLAEFDMRMDTEFTQDSEAVDAPMDASADVNQLTQLLSDIPSVVMMPGLMQGRTLLVRTQMANQFGGSGAGVTHASVNRALQWLKNHQLPSGAWTQSGEPGNPCPGHTGLALLAFLSHGETPASKEYGETVIRAIRWIVENQNSNGVIGRSSNTVYGHAMATYALAEAFTVTQHIMIREPLTRAVDVIVNGMQANGGFDYGYRRGDRNDSSVAGWQVQALKAATIAFPEDARIQRALQLAMDGMLLNSRSSQGGGRTIGYTSPGSNPNITAAGALGMIFSGRTKDRQTQELMTTLQDVEPKWEGARSGALYFWYYVAQAKFQFDPRGRDFRSFNVAMIREFVGNQNPDGSWDEPAGGGGVRGRAGETAIAALTLMVYYRHLPTGMLENMPTTPPPPPVVDDDIIRITIEKI